MLLLLLVSEGSVAAVLLDGSSFCGSRLIHGAFFKTAFQKNEDSALENVYFGISKVEMKAAIIGIPSSLFGTENCV